MKNWKASAGGRRLKEIFIDQLILGLTIIVVVIPNSTILDSKAVM